MKKKQLNTSVIATFKDGNTKTFNTIEEAHNAYKIYTEHKLKVIAETYKSMIPECLYNALCNYEININD